MIIEFAKGVALLLALSSVQGFILFRWRRSERIGSALSGGVFGLICIFGMMTPIVLSDGVFFDARSVILCMAGLFAGPVGATIAAVLAGGYRIWLGGTGAAVGVSVVVACVLLGLAYRECSRRGWLRVRAGELLLFGFVVHLVTIGIFIFLPAPIAERVMADIAVPMLVTFTPATALLGLLLKAIGEQISTRQSLEEANLRFRQIAENIREVFWMIEPASGDVMYISPGYERMWGRSCESLYRDPRSYLEAVHPEDRGVAESALVHDRSEPSERIYRIVRPDGSVRTIRSLGFPVRNDKGEVYRIAGVAEDITDLEERGQQLRQAQKMEALGQLTGGVAHDFNNLLMIIQGNAEMLGDRLPANDPSLTAIARASRRGAELTQRLLSFARRQPLKAVPVDVAALTEHVAVLLQRTLGPEITLIRSMAPDLWPALVDPGQLENALVNLSINARDAMAQKGTLTVSGENVTVSDRSGPSGDMPEKGDYVVLSVRDTGCGMPDHVKAQAFEPFFTTKAAGEGSGLGLSMVYGFAKQSGGHVRIDTADGAGTTVSLYLPRAPETLPARESSGNAAVVPAGNGRTVLVVEDDPDVRSLTVALVASLGYRTLEAGSAQEAMALLGTGQEIDALLCDVVLAGGTSGPEFARTAVVARPDVAVVFMSGYPQDHIRDMEGWLPEAVLISKPFTKARLSEALSSALC